MGGQHEETGAWTQATDPAASTTVQRVTITGASSLGEAAVGIWPPPARLSPSNLAIAARLAAAVRRTSPETDWTDAARSSSPIRKPSTGTALPRRSAGRHWTTRCVPPARGRPLDIAALVPIIEEAGGTYAELADTPPLTLRPLCSPTPTSVADHQHCEPQVLTIAPTRVRGGDRLSAAVRGHLPTLSRAVGRSRLDRGVTAVWSAPGAESGSRNGQWTTPISCAVYMAEPAANRVLWPMADGRMPLERQGSGPSSIRRPRCRSRWRLWHGGTWNRVRLCSHEGARLSWHTPSRFSWLRHNVWP